MRGLAVAAASTIALLSGQFGAAGAEAPTQPAGSLDRLVSLLAERLDTADSVAAAKWTQAERDGTQPTIDDPTREAAIYADMIRLGAQQDLPATQVRQAFEAQIDANKIVQRGLVTLWNTGLSPAPSTAPDLTSVRPIIDRVNVEIIDELARDHTELAAPDCTARLIGSVLATVGTRHLDPLHQAALTRASIPLCEA
ncbi:gamma subclass chorismate mutase AroQ [Nocardia sp. CDC160]|uniref:gamma subclass chorismate mutase AroQ n=1 Tax=Nocardia sp. CDC160 TaxID=3112166 RepID=UPI002DB99990|nr:gamma subclass chorismate mutase AroQ [Nocardia sp. CDC160]MEC3917943.1 gamma subclass chorismate mutase AroQ [Nocardia sp. CDC160]